MKSLLIAKVAALAAAACLAPFTPTLAQVQPAAATAPQAYFHKPVAEKKLKELPPGPLYWLVENFPTLAQAQAAAGPTSLAVENAGTAWLFTLGTKGGSTPGASRVVEVGPVPTIAAPEYLLRINHSGGAPGAKTPVHTHPGSEAFYVLERTWCRHADGGIQ